jgi:hypothetical protein
MLGSQESPMESPESVDLSFSASSGLDSAGGDGPARPGDCVFCLFDGA